MAHAGHDGIDTAPPFVRYPTAFPPAIPMWLPSI